MINRYNVNSDIVDLVVSIMQNPPVNEIDPIYINAPNPKYKYEIIKHRRIYSCEQANIQMYVLINDIKDRVVSNCQMECDCYVLVGLIRRKDTYIDSFANIISALTLHLSPAAKLIIFEKLSLGTVSYTDIRLGSFGIKNIQVNSSNSKTDTCGVFNYEMIVKVTFNYSK